MDARSDLSTSEYILQGKEASSNGDSPYSSALHACIIILVF